MQDQKCDSTLASNAEHRGADSHGAKVLDKNIAKSIAPEALDALSVGVIATNGFRQPLLANRTAHKILSARDGLVVNEQGILDTSKRSQRSTLADLITCTANQSVVPNAPARTSLIAVERVGGKRPLTVVVRPVTGSVQTASATRSTVLIFVIDPEHPVRATETWLRQLYCITVCEARLANLLMEGNSLDQCCERLGIRTSTARMHLGNLFAKTGVQRQGQLISLLLASVGMIRNLTEAGADSEATDGKQDRSGSSALEIEAAGLEALNRLGIGVAVISRARRLLLANPAAKRLLAARDGLELNSQGILNTPEPGVSSLWYKLAQRSSFATASRTFRQLDTLIAVARPGKRTLTLIVRPLTARLSDGEAPAFLLFMLDPEYPIQLAEDGLRQLYGLTRCEARLANLLIEGKTLDVCCDELHIMPSTARMHLSNLFAKTGVQRQGQLIALLLRSLGMIRTLDAGVRSAA